MVSLLTGNSSPAATAAIIEPSRPNVFGSSMLSTALCAPTFGLAVTLIVTGVFSGNETFDVDSENVPSLPRKRASRA